jgi:EmrB/QacA subfamily drug resistance transporter
MTSTASETAHGDAGRAERHPFFVLAIVLTAVFVQLLDISIVNVAIPSIQRDIGATFGSIQLVIAGYQLAFACLLITGARLGDIYGRKKLFLAGMTLFTLSSLACGISPNSTTLVLARVFQGLGSGLMFPQVLAVIQVTIPGKDRGKAFGIFGATIGLATILGPLLGGILISLNLFGTDWRAIFLVNLPIGAFALIAAYRDLPDSKAPDAPKLDILGTILVTTGLFLLVYPLTEGREKGWPAWIWAMLVLSVPVLVGFVVLQRRKTAAEAGPLLLMTLFRNKAFRAGLVLSSVFFLGVAPFFFGFSLYLQVGLGFTALHSGLITFPFALGSAFASSQSDKLVQRIGTRVLSIGTALLTLSMVGVILVINASGRELHAWAIGPVLFVAGLGLGLFIAPVTNLVLAGIQGREAGSASGVLSTMQQIGGALGVAVIGIVLFGLLGSNASAAAHKESAPLASQLTSVPKAALTTVIDGKNGFVDCFVRRSKSPDPTSVPAGCTPPKGANPAVSAALTSAGTKANADNFRYSIVRTLFFEVGVFLLAFLIVPLLPKVDPKTLGRGGGGAAA